MTTTTKNPEERLKEFEEYLGKRAKKGKSNFFSGNAIQVITCGEATTLFFDNAIAMKEGQWWYILTEHNGNHWYCAEDVRVRFYQRIDRKEAEGPLNKAK